MPQGQQLIYIPVSNEKQYIGSSKQYIEPVKQDIEILDEFSRRMNIPDRVVFL